MVKASSDCRRFLHMAGTARNSCAVAPRQFNKDSGVWKLAKSPGSLDSPYYRRAARACRSGIGEARKYRRGDADCRATPNQEVPDSPL